MRVIIADTSCLILYDKINQFEILQKTFTELIVTREVAEEYGELPNWVTTKEVTDNGQYLKLAEDLGKGEASSIALALEFRTCLKFVFGNEKDSFLPARQLAGRQVLMRQGAF